MTNFFQLFFLFSGNFGAKKSVKSSTNVFRSPCIKFSPVASPSKCGKPNKHQNHNVANRRRSSDEKNTRTVYLNEYDHIFSRFVFSFEHDEWLLNRILYLILIIYVLLRHSRFEIHLVLIICNLVVLKLHPLLLKCNTPQIMAPLLDEHVQMYNTKTEDLSHLENKWRIVTYYICRYKKTHFISRKMCF